MDSGRGITKKNRITVPEAKLADQCSLPLFSIGAFICALLWMGITSFRHKQTAPVIKWSGFPLFLIIGVIYWSLEHATFQSHFSDSSPIKDDDSGELTQTLGRNICRTFDFRAESDIYNALTHNVDGQLLDRLFLQIQNGLRMQEQSGAIVRVKEVKVVNCQMMNSHSDSEGLPQFKSKCLWRVVGTVEHWGIFIHGKMSTRLCLQ
ncbi:MAG: hypothetical protein SWO11_21895 [Thermodesulfobacteriota bacterium]|nr:hypothetical protein [Thermodesulfobacteriota bacterium]